MTQATPFVITDAVLADLKVSLNDYRVQAHKVFNARLIDLAKFTELQSSKVQSINRDRDMQAIANALNGYDLSLRRLMDVINGINSLLEHHVVIAANFPLIAGNFEGMISVIKRNLNPPPNMQPRNEDAMLAVMFGDVARFIASVGFPEEVSRIQLA